jgi:hypothetical protein
VTAPVSVVLAVLGLIVSAKTRFHGIPVLWLLAAALVLALLALVLHLIRVLREEFGRQPEPVIKTVRWERI